MPALFVIFNAPQAPDLWLRFVGREAVGGVPVPFKAI